MHGHPRKNFGFTLTELLVVLAIIGSLVGLLLPAVLQAREAARRIQCKNNLHQVAIAVGNYESAFGYLPPAAYFDINNHDSDSNRSWSVHGRILPFLEQSNLASGLDMATSWKHQFAIDGKAIPNFRCPSDPLSRVLRDRGSSQPRLYATNVAFNYGPLFVYDPIQGEIGDGLFVPNRPLPYAMIRDGLSQTLLAGEVRSWQPYVRNQGWSHENPPQTPESLSQFLESKISSRQSSNFFETGHTVWPDARVHHVGFTTWFPPNTQVLITLDSQVFDVDYNSWQEGKDGNLGLPTFAVATSRSMHSGLVHVVYADGSVHSIADTIERSVWQALSTRAGSDSTSDLYR